MSEQSVIDRSRYLVKICGLRLAKDAAAAALAGADFIGFIYYPASPRHVSLENAKILGPDLPAKGPKRVGVFVDADNDVLQRFCTLLDLDYIQLHGSETPERIKEIKSLLGLPVIKVIKVAEKEDILEADSYQGLVDMLLFDTKPESSDALPGGTGRRFPWHFLKDYKGDTPFLLAGGLNPRNAVTALMLSGASGLDVSSGVELEPGIKSHQLITDFIDIKKQDTP